MQSAIEDLNNRTVAELLKAINESMLATPWKVEGGWTSWFYSVFKKIAFTIGKFVCSAVPDSAGYEKRLNEYFQEQGYDSEQAGEMTQHWVTKGGSK